MRSLLKQISVYIDAENTNPYTLDGIFDFMANNALTPIVIKAFADWSKPNLTSYKPYLQKYAIEAVHHYGVSKKQTADSLLQIHVMDALHQLNIGYFAIVSSDQDFSPLILRARQSQKHVYVFGKNNTLQCIQNAATKFICTDDQARLGREPSKPNLSLTQAIESALYSSADNNQLSLPSLGQYLTQHLPNYNALKMGKPLRKLVEATGRFIVTNKSGIEFVSLRQ